MTVAENIAQLQKQFEAKLEDVYNQGPTLPPGINPNLLKSVTSALGFQGYNLSNVVAEFEPMWDESNVFLKRIPRVGPANGQMGDRARWKNVTSVRGGQMSSPEGWLGNELTTTSEDVEKAYKTLSSYDSVSYESQWQGQGFMDVKGSAIVRLLRNFRRGEEYQILGGNITKLGNVGAVTLTPGSVGTIAAGSYTVKVAPVTASALNGVIRNQNFADASLVLPGFVNSIGVAVSGAYNGVGYDGIATSSAATVTTNDGSIVVSIATTSATKIPAYAIYMKLSTDSVYTLQAVSTRSSFTLTTYVTTTNSILPTAEGSADSTSFDGIIPQIYAAGNKYGKDNGNARLTAAGTGISEINDVLQNVYDAYQVSITNISVSGNLRQGITEALLQKGGIYNLVDQPELDKLTTGRSANIYIHPATAKRLTIETHPYLPDGMILMTTERVDIPELGIDHLFAMHMCQDYFQRDVMTPYRRMAYELSTRSVLGMRAPQYSQIISNARPTATT